MRPRVVARAVALSSLLAALAAPVLGHGVEIVVECSGLDCELTARYDGSRGVTGATVEIYASDAPQRPAVRGTTDLAGRLRFELDAPGRYSVRVDDGHGHRQGAVFRADADSATQAGSDGPSGALARPLRWLGGLGIIALLSIAYAWIARRRRGPRSP